MPERKSQQTRVAGLVRSAKLIARARDAIGAGVCFDVASGLKACLKLLGATSYSAVIVQIDVDSSLTDNSAILRLRSDNPELPILGYLSSPVTPTSFVADAVHAGASSVVAVDRDDDPFSFRRALRHVERQSLSARLYRSLARVVDPACLHILRYAVDHLTEQRSVDDAARVMGVDRKTLNNRLRRAGHPPASEFLTWIRVAAAVELLSTSQRPASQVAAELGFTTGPALRAALDRYLGITTERARSMTSAAVMERLGRSRVVAAFDIRAARSMHLAPFDGERHQCPRCGAAARSRTSAEVGACGVGL
jgi:AraC-like DNA-binding protein